MVQCAATACGVITRPAATLDRWMMGSNWVWVPIGFYMVGWAGEFRRYWSRSASSVAWPGGLLAIGWGAHTVGLALLLLREPFTVGALLVICAWLVLVAFYFSARLQAVPFVRSVLPPLAVALLLSAAFSTEHRLLGPGAEESLPWLSGNLLTAHIVAFLAGHLFFGLACLASIGYLLQERRLKAKPLRGTEWVKWGLPSLGALETLTHRAITLGFFFLTVGILLGLTVAGQSGQSAASQALRDLRLIIPMVSWACYAGFLLVYDYQGRRGRFSALWSIAGFGVIVTSLVFEMTVLTTTH